MRPSKFLKERIHGTNENYWFPRIIIAFRDFTDDFNFYYYDDDDILTINYIIIYNKYIFQFSIFISDDMFIRFIQLQVAIYVSFREGGYVRLVRVS